MSKNKVNQSSEPIETTIQVTYFGDEEPTVKMLGKVEGVRVELIDGEEGKWTFMEHKGTRVYHTMCHENRDDLSECWFHTERGRDRDDEGSFDVRDLDPIPEQLRDQYEGLFKDEKFENVREEKMKMAYAIETGDIQSDFSV